MSKKDEVLENLWENLNEALYDARHYLSMGEKKNHQDAMLLIQATIEGIRLRTNNY